MKFPLSMTAGLAKYIFKNKMRPRPEWQKTVAAAPDASNPFRILPMKTGEKRQPHPIIKKRLGEFKPDKRFYFNVHLDGMEKNHDIAVEKVGVFRDAIEGIKLAKA